MTLSHLGGVDQHWACFTPSFLKGMVERPVVFLLVLVVGDGLPGGGAHDLQPGGMCHVGHMSYNQHGVVGKQGERGRWQSSHTESSAIPWRHMRMHL